MAMTDVEFRAEFVDPAKARLAEAEQALAEAETALVAAQAAKRAAEARKARALKEVRALKDAGALIYPEGEDA